MFYPEVILLKNHKVKRSLLALFLVIALVLSSVSLTRAGSLKAKEAGTAQIPVNLIVNGQTFRAVFYNNKTANALLKKMPMTLNMKELNGNEKYHFFDTEFPTNEKSPGKISAGDIMLYGSDCLVTFYKSHRTSYQYTSVGKIEDASGFAKAVGSGNVSIKLVSAAVSSKTEIRLKVDNRLVSGKTISIKKGKKKKIKVSVSQKKNYKISFRSNKSSIASVSKTGKITAKRIGTAKLTVIAKSKSKSYKSWVKVKVVSANKKNENSLASKKPISTQTGIPALPSDIPEVTPSDTPMITPSDTPAVVPSDAPTVAPSDTPTVVPSNIPTIAPTVVPSVSPTITPTESPAPDTGDVLDMYEITLRVDGKEFPAKLYQTETTKSIMQKLPLSITMNELNGNEKYYYFSENFPTESQRVSKIHAGDLKLYGSSCLVLFYESFSTAYSYTSLGYVENSEGLAEALGSGSVHVDIF